MVGTVIPRGTVRRADIMQASHGVILNAIILANFKVQAANSGTYRVYTDFRSTSDASSRPISCPCMLYMYSVAQNLAVFILQQEHRPEQFPRRLPSASGSYNVRFQVTSMALIPRIHDEPKTTGLC